MLLWRFLALTHNRSADPTTEQVKSEWVSGGCGALAVALQERFPNLHIAAEMYMDHGTMSVVHAWAYDGTHRFDAYGANKWEPTESPDYAYESTHVELDVTPEQLDRLFSGGYSKDGYPDADYVVEEMFGGQEPLQRETPGTAEDQSLLVAQYKMAADPDPMVRKRLALNPDTSAEVLLVLAGDQIPGVRRAARRTTAPAPAPLQSRAADPAQESYRISHQPTGGSQLHNLADGATFPSDVYDNLRSYASLDGADDTAAHLAESLAAIRAVRAKPDAPVTIYRAVPPGVESIERGNWVTLSRSYAQTHARGTDLIIIESTVPASTIEAGGNDVIEWGYFPSGSGWDD